MILNQQSRVWLILGSLRIINRSSCVDIKFAIVTISHLLSVGLRFSITGNVLYLCDENRFIILLTVIEPSIEGCRYAYLHSINVLLRRKIDPRHFDIEQTGGSVFISHQIYMFLIGIYVNIIKCSIWAMIALHTGEIAGAIRFLVRQLFCDHLSRR